MKKGSKLHKNQRKERDINTISEGTWESAHTVCPPPNTSKSLTKLLSQMYREESRRYWQDVHGIPRNEYLNARRFKVNGVPSGLVQETSKLNW